jgi:hypothetical protein
MNFDEAVTEVIATIVGQETLRAGVTYPVTRVLRFEFETYQAALSFLDTSHMGRKNGLIDSDELVSDRHGVIEVFAEDAEGIEPIFMTRDEDAVREYLKRVPNPCYAVDQAGNTLQKDGTWQIAGKDFT